MQNNLGRERCSETSQLQQAATGRAEDLDPIDFMLDTHHRMIGMCDRLSAVSDDLWLRGRELTSTVLLTFLETELPLHLDDERFSLLPRLRCRLGGTTIAEALMKNIEERLGHDHELVRQLVDRVVGGLTAICNGSVPEHPALFAIELIRLELHLREHMNWQEALVFPIARDHLAAEDMVKMMREIAERRGWNRDVWAAPSAQG